MKEFKTIDEQLELLKERGLIVPDDFTDQAKSFLLKNNYYRISGYSLTLRKDDLFYPDVTIKNIIDIYDCDREMRNLLLWAIEIIEVNIKSLYAYTFSRKHGGLGYSDPAHFSSVEKHAAILKKANDAIPSRLKHEAYLQHYINELQEPLPLWAYVDLFTISDISQLYAISELSLQQEIAAEYGLTHRKAATVIANFFHGLTIIRNLCAHDSRLFNRIFIRKPDLSKSEKRLLREDENGLPDNSHLFGYILNIKRLLTDDEFEIFKGRLKKIHELHSFVDMKHYGFPDNWDDVI